MKIVLGCDKEFAQLKEVVQHWTDDHPGTRNLRPDDKPFRPTVMRRLPKLPRVVPAYATTVSLQSRPSLISKERHQEIGPRVCFICDVLVQLKLMDFKDIQEDLWPRQPERTTFERAVSVTSSTAAARCSPT